MISVEQIRALEERIEKALSFIAALRAENASLEGRLSAAESLRGKAEARAEEAELRVLELEEAAEAFRRDQARIEEGILHALEKLDAFEDLVLVAGGRGPDAGVEESPLAEKAASALAPSAPASVAAPSPAPSRAPEAEAESPRIEAEPPLRPAADLEELPAAQVGELDIF